MKIIKQGQVPAERVFRQECNHCGTIFEYAQSEGKFSYDPKEGSAIVIKCPVCTKLCYQSLGAYLK